MLLGRYVGLRTLWLIAAGLGMLGLVVFASIHFARHAHHADCSWSACRYDHRPQFRLLGDASQHYRIWRARDRASCRRRRCLEWRRCCSGSRSGLRPRSSAGAMPRRAMSRTSSRAARRLARMRQTVALVPLVFLALSCVAMRSIRSGGVRARRRELAGGLGPQLEHRMDAVALGGGRDPYIERARLHHFTIVVPEEGEVAGAKRETNRFPTGQAPARPCGRPSARAPAE